MRADAARVRIAHGLTGMRLAAAPPLAAALWWGYASTALVLIAVAAASDVLDGRMARRYGVASDRGRWFDHGADIAFLLAGFITLAAAGEVSYAVPLAVGGAFAVYAGDVRWRGERSSRLAGRLGHMGGVLNYVVLTIVALDLATAAALLPAGLRQAAVAAVPWYSGAAVLARFTQCQAALRPCANIARRKTRLTARGRM